MNNNKMSINIKEVPREWTKYLSCSTYYHEANSILGVA